MAADITNELFAYRPLSQLIPTLVLPSVESRVARGTLKESDLPVELDRLQILWDNPGAPTVQLNEEVQIDLRAEPTRTDYKVGEPLTLSDFKPETARFNPPTAKGKPVAYYLATASFMDLMVFMDFGPNAPGGNTGPSLMPPYPIAELADRKELVKKHPPEELLRMLKQLGWPPSPALYPDLAIALLKEADAESTISSSAPKVLNADYWNRRLALWEELMIFGARMPYIRRAVDEYMEGDSISAIYVIVPQFEGIIIDYVKSSKGSVRPQFREALNEFRDLILSRKVLLFPKFTLDLVLDFIDSGTFWNKTATIGDTQSEVNRHGIAHGVLPDSRTNN